jgi:hypothetical protein
LTPLDLAIANQKADCVTFLRLAILAVSEGGTSDESFLEALNTFSLDAQRQEEDNAAASPKMRDKLSQSDRSTSFSSVTDIDEQVAWSSYSPQVK